MRPARRTRRLIPRKPIPPLDFEFFGSVTFSGTVGIVVGSGGFGMVGEVEEEFVDSPQRVSFQSRNWPVTSGRPLSQTLIFQVPIGVSSLKKCVRGLFSERTKGWRRTNGKQT